MPVLKRLSKLARKSFEAAVDRGSWGGYKLTYNFDAGYTDPDTGRFCLHPSFLEAEFTPPSQSADDGQGDMKVEQETVRGTEPSNNRTTVSHEQANASNQASVLFCQDTAGNPMLAAGISAEADLADMGEPYKAFKRLHWKLKLPQAANVCEWATHVHLGLSPHDKTSGPVVGQARLLHSPPRVAHEASQQLFKELPKLSESEGTVERTERADEQMGLHPDQIASNHGESSFTSCCVPKPHGLASALQINIREVLGHGNTATIYAGH
ncbi:hypothetical protein WJX79_001014 [Trebouxia sp. C0005]